MYIVRPVSRHGRKLPALQCLDDVHIFVYVVSLRALGSASSSLEALCIAGYHGFQDAELLEQPGLPHVRNAASVDPSFSVGIDDRVIG